MPHTRVISIFVFILLFQSYGNAEELAAEDKSILGKIRPRTAYQYFSGYYKNNHNHPAIYAFGYKQHAKLVVTGRGFYKEFPISQWSKAMAAYKSVLRNTGYMPPN